MAYRFRDDRCEGIYAQPVNSTQLRLTSLIRSFEFNSAAREDLVISWGTLPESFGKQPIRLRAVSQKPKIFYRMDTAVASTEESFRWPTGILAYLEFDRYDVGLLGWTRSSIDGSEPQNVFVPLSAKQDTTSKGSGQYEIFLVPQHRLREIYVTLKPIEKGGRAGIAVWQDQPMGQGFYQAGLATKIRVPVLTKPGVYRVELSAKFYSKGSATHSFLFYHSGSEMGAER